MEEVGYKEEERRRKREMPTVALNLELQRVEKQIMFAGESSNVYRVLLIYRVVQFARLLLPLLTFTLIAPIATGL